MASIQWHEESTVYKNDTGPVLEFLFLDVGGLAPINLTGWCGWVSFWYPDSAPHVCRAAEVDGVNGILRYYPQGDEFSTVGAVRMQAEAMLVDATTGTDRAFFTVPHEIVRRRVVEKPT